MKRFRDILLLADSKTEGERTLKRAVSLAKSNQARLTVVDVVKKMPGDMQRLFRSKHLADIQDLIIQDRLKQLKHLITPIKDEGVQVTAKVLQGRPVIEIVREVLRNKHDLVIIAAEGKKGLKGMLFGTITLRLMRKCPCPVWAIKHAKRKRFARILAAVDPGPSDDVRSALNAKIMELASSLARSEKSELHVIYIWTLYGESILRNHVRLPHNEVNKMVHETKKMQKLWLGELLKKYAPGIPNKQVHLLKGEAGTLIPELAKKKRIELIVMGTVSQTGVTGLLIGDTTEKVLQQVNCSVLAVKPDGFISPVKLD
jgi:nucleotide-binding universal stress UspA family protein